MRTWLLLVATLSLTGCFTSEPNDTSTEASCEDQCAGAEDEECYIRCLAGTPKPKP